ncbi:MAG: MlaA family lipoprotein [Thiogranum sp.]
MTTAKHKFSATLLLLMAVLAVTGCSTKPIMPEGEDIIPPEFSAERVLGTDFESFRETAISDPWEGFNRAVFRFNYRFDRYVFLPAVSAYQAVTPDVVETGVHNFFRNIQDITTLINSVLQLDFDKTMHTTTRLMVNSTIGLAGFINVASDVPRSDEDFGQTLGHWGVGTGPFLVLPVLGPSNVRDGIGTGVDWYALSEIRDRTTDLETWQELTWDILKALDLRAHTAFRYFETGSPFEYEWIRLLYTTKRQLDVER